MHWSHILEGVIGGLIVGIPSLALAWLLMKRQQQFQLKVQQRQENFQRKLETDRVMRETMDKVTERIGVIGSRDSAAGDSHRRDEHPPKT